MNMAVVETGGKQYLVHVGDRLVVEKLPVVKGEKVVFDKVLLLDDGKETQVGIPYIAGAKIEGELLEEGRGKKITVIRYRQKSRYFKKRGHRQPYSKVRITALS